MRDRQVTDIEAREVIEKGTKQISDSDIEHVIEREEEIKRKFRGPLGKFINDGKTLFDLIKDYWHKKYREVPWWTIGASATALLYVLNPMDLVPDFIPFVGLLDDATVVSACIFMLERDLTKYRKWKRSQSADSAYLSDTE